MPEITVWVVLALVAAAFLAGWVDAIVGGGGLIQLPALLIALPDATPVATISGTNKISSFAGTASASLAYLRRVPIRWQEVVPLMAGAGVGSAIGARMVTLLSRDAFTPLVLAALVTVAVLLWRRPRLGLENHVRHAGPGLAVRTAAIGLGVGVYDGFLGPGTGTFFVMGLVSVVGYGFLEASVRAKLANLTTNLAAIATLAAHIHWGLGLVMAAANIAGGLTGARMAMRLGNRFVRRVLTIVVAFMIVRLGADLVRSLTG